MELVDEIASQLAEIKQLKGSLKRGGMVYQLFHQKELTLSLASLIGTHLFFWITFPVHIGLDEMIKVFKLLLGWL